MAHTAALISYPCLKDLEKSNINFVECATAHQKKNRKSRYDKKEPPLGQKVNYNVDHNFVCNRENSTTNTPKVKKKDIAILPTLHENEEKEENRKELYEVRKTSDFVTNKESAVYYEADAILSSYGGEGRARRRFSNHSLVTYDTFEELSASKLLLDSNTQDHNRKLTSTLTECRRASSVSDLSLSKIESDSSKLQSINCEPHITLMPNTNEFKELRFDESLQELRETSKMEPNTRKRSHSDWRIILGVIWAISLLAAMIYVTVIAVSTQSPRTLPVELGTFMPKNYEICLLIGQNVRRLIASSVVNLLQTEL